ncbi:YdcF family protein [Agrilutibacter solisilvae]|uniref:YdcF family protein n=1 Tax=Agrilutibacter solisilvae TaxID=2763317 RepID=A0A974Y2F1_9GAMM|nr:YdcF family protein [Lysobacter solisilvae]QSX79308.1 YdcF family protein [Lysobacter solisilvae]
MSSRTAHRLSIAVDRDVLHAGVVALSACVLSAGLVYVGYLVHVWRVARRAPCAPAHGECVLLFGKNAPGGRIDADFAARLDRAIAVAQAHPPQRFVLLGGGARDELTEAELAREQLLARGLDRALPLQLESRSRDTLQNLRNARALLGALPASPAPRVTLLSSRYHLARCALFARQLGFDWELCAAEPRLPAGLQTAWRLAGEAAYVCWIDPGDTLGAADPPPADA